jgi:transcriptional regulator with XRE-family HTH domain
MASVKLLVARNLKRARKQARLSQHQLAERARVSDGYIGDIEAGRKYPSAEALERLVGALGLRPYQLYLEEQEWELRERTDALTHMYRDLKERINSELESALKRHMS